jgi:hypothetical protein
MAIGMATPMARTRVCPAATKMASPMSRSQPTCRLGMAAYWLVNMAGCSTRYACDPSVTVSTMPRPASRGGATGKLTNTTMPTAPEISIALRVR